MTKTINKGRAEGTILAPSSKSIAHRALIMAAMCDGKESVIRGITPSEDVLATIDCLKALGVKIEYADCIATVVGIDFTRAEAGSPLNCRESGSTMRFLIPLATMSGRAVSFIGGGRLLERPLDIYEKVGLKIERGDGITVSGRLIAGEYHISGDVSSQFITGMLFALSALPEKSKIIIDGKIQSKPYIDLTLDMLKGARWEKDNSILILPEKLPLGDFTVPGDWSAAANLLALNYLGGKVKVERLDERSLQGDVACIKHFDALSRGFAEINVENTPDLCPILFALAAEKWGGKFVGTGRLKIKESDRAEAMRQELAKFGAKLTVEEDSVTVYKCDLHTPQEPLCGHNDHRIVMALAVMCTVYGGEIDGCEAVAKSYPDFFTHLESLLNPKEN